LVQYQLSEISLILLFALIGGQAFAVGTLVDSSGRWHHLFDGSLIAAKERVVLTAR
jgi:hypothetical protein